MKFSPQRLANEVTSVLRSVGESQFPVNVRNIALEITKAKYPDDPISIVKGRELPGFEGALAPAPSGKNGWGIFYNSGIESQGRINFTLGHEFGHYLLHRKAYPNGFTCSSGDMADWESEYAQRESEANIFAATLLMPLDDFRSQVDSQYKPNFDDLGSCANRYDVSLIAATLRWLQYTARQSILVVSRDGFILWARSSKRALDAGYYFKTSNMPPIEVPSNSLAANSSFASNPKGVLELDKDVWFKQACTEHVLISKQYDFTLTLLHMVEN